MTTYKQIRRTLSALALAALPLAAPPASATPASATPTTTPSATPAAIGEWVGVYRIEASRNAEVVPMLVLVERSGERLQVTVLVDNHASALEGVRSESGALIGLMQTSHGRGELVLRSADGGVAGTLTVGKRTWTVLGQRSL